jgi:NADPH-dependent ferric siderophore reductase
MTLRVLRPSDRADPVETVRRTAPDNLSAAFVACEAGLMRALRRLAIDEFGIRRDRLFTSGYWKAGITTEEVDTAKRRPDWFADPHP